MTTAIGAYVKSPDSGYQADIESASTPTKGDLERLCASALLSAYHFCSVKRAILDITDGLPSQLPLQHASFNERRSLISNGACLVGEISRDFYAVVEGDPSSFRAKALKGRLTCAIDNLDELLSDALRA